MSYHKVLMNKPKAKLREFNQRRMDKYYNRPRFGVSEPGVTYTWKDGECLGYTCHPKMYHANKPKLTGPVKQVRRRPRPKNKVTCDLKIKPKHWSDPEITDGWDWKKDSSTELVPVSGETNETFSFIQHLDRVLTTEIENPPRYQRIVGWSRVMLVKGLQDEPIYPGKPFEAYMKFGHHRPDFVIYSDSVDRFDLPECQDIVRRLGSYTRIFNDEEPTHCIAAVLPCYLHKQLIAVHVSLPALKAELEGFNYSLRPLALAAFIKDFSIKHIVERLGGEIELMASPFWDQEVTGIELMAEE